MEIFCYRMSREQNTLLDIKNRQVYRVFEIQEQDILQKVLNTSLDSFFFFCINHSRNVVRGTFESLTGERNYIATE